MNEMTLAQYLKSNSRATHDSVDSLVMSVKPFDNKENYIKFLRLQAVFHKIVDAVYQDPVLNQKIPNLASLARYDDVMRDLQDLDGKEEPIQLAIPQPEDMEALGWLYCAEGSNVGAAFLFKDAQEKLGYNAQYGARHLGPHVDGRGKHWREFVEYFNALGIEGENREAALRGALNAFAFYKKLLREIFAV